MVEVNLQTLLDAEKAMNDATDHFSDTKQRLARKVCPYAQGTSTTIIWKNRESELLVDTVLIRKRKSDGRFEWVASGYVHPHGRESRTNARTEVTGIVTE